MGFHGKVSVAPVLRSGTGNFGGYGLYTTIALSPAMPGTDYNVIISSVANSVGVGEVWISDKASNSFRVNNTGSGVSAFEWQAEAN
jgi:hypothetical protein